MYSILRIQYVHYTPDSVVQYTPKYSIFVCWMKVGSVRHYPFH
ncbi:hypothetical protein LCGC14_1863780 [marine sediment metagenome]|uniref:Uncharacterized protein n=1 Tax=marine sediment metagenome TaxID=412755 RepID=A0A0F9J5P6_9ZZZZ